VLVVTAGLVFRRSFGLRLGVVALVVARSVTAVMVMVVIVAVLMAGLGLVG
jgi:hypothetical protein